MPRVTRRSLNEEETPSRSSPRAATKASSAASASPARASGRRSLRGDETKAGEKPQDSVEKRGRNKSASQEKDKASRQSRSRGRQAEEAAEKVTTPPVKRGRSQRSTRLSAESSSGRKPKQQEESEEEASAEEKEAVTPNARKGRSQGRSQVAGSRGVSGTQGKSPASATTTSTRTSRSRRSAGTAKEEPLEEAAAKLENKATPTGRSRGRQTASASRSRSRGKGKEKASEDQDDEAAEAEEGEESGGAKEKDIKAAVAGDQTKVADAAAGQSSSELEKSSEADRLAQSASTAAKSSTEVLSDQAEPMEQETDDGTALPESSPKAQNGEISSKKALVPASGTKRKLGEKEEAVEEAADRDGELSSKRPRLNGNGSNSTEGKDDVTEMTDLTEAEKEDEDILKDYVVINAEDLPASNSPEVAEAVPQTVTKQSATSPAVVSVADVMEVDNKAGSAAGDVTVLPLTEAEVAKVYSAQVKEQETDEISSTVVEVGSVAGSDVTGSVSRGLDASEQQSSSNSIDGDDADASIVEGDSNLDGGDSVADTAQALQSASDASRAKHIPDVQAQISSSGTACENASPSAVSELTKAQCSLQVNDTASPVGARPQAAADIPASEGGVDAAGAARSKPEEKARTVKTPSSVLQSLGTPDPTFLATYSSPSIQNRAYVPNPSVPASSIDPTKTFSVISYNILAECHRQRSDYSFTPEEFLGQDYRHKLMMNEIKYLSGDVVCMQEVNPAYYEGTLLPEMKRLGFEGIMMRRTKDFYDEGEATFYKTDRFELESSKGVSLTEVAFKEVELSGLSPEVGAAVREYLDRADVVLVTRLRCKVTGKLVTIGNIHVVWDNRQSPDVQCIQAACGIKEVVSMAGGEGSPHIICGDFNAEWNSPEYQLVVDSYLSDSSIQALQAVEGLKLEEGSRSLVNHLWRAFQHTSSNLRSAYSTVTGSEPEVTTFVGRPSLAVDYVFFNATSLVPVGVLKTVDRAAVELTGGLPAKEFPSDHLSLKAILAFTD